MKHIVVNDNIYLVSDKMYKNVVTAFALANTIDGDMSALADAIKKNGKYIGTVYLVIRR